MTSIPDEITRDDVLQAVSSNLRYRTERDVFKVRFPTSPLHAWTVTPFTPSEIGESWNQIREVITPYLKAIRLQNLETLITK